jgi:hypothetical protein
LTDRYEPRILPDVSCNCSEFGVPAETVWTLWMYNFYGTSTLAKLLIKQTVLVLVIEPEKF